MKYILSIICLFFLSSCCQKKGLFYIQHTKAITTELPSDCARDFINKINTMWLKHGQRDCHYYNPFIQSFGVIGSENRECLVEMEISLVQKLLGKPDKVENGKIIYVFDNKCDEKMDIEPNAVYRKDLVFHYSSKSNKITDVKLVGVKRNPEY